MKMLMMYWFSFSFILILFVSGTQSGRVVVKDHLDDIGLPYEIGALYQKGGELVISTSVSVHFEKYPFFSQLFFSFLVVVLLTILNFNSLLEFSNHSLQNEMPNSDTLF
jgi:hypothetical protein